MCTILDAAEERGVNRGETLKLIMMVQKKIKKGDSIAKIADGLVEDEIVISPIYKMVKEYPEDTERDIYQRVTCWGFLLNGSTEPSIHKLSSRAPRFFCPDTGVFFYYPIVWIPTVYAVNILFASSRMLIAALRSLSISFPHSQ